MSWCTHCEYLLYFYHHALVDDASCNNHTHVSRFQEPVRLTSTGFELSYRRGDFMKTAPCSLLVQEDGKLLAVAAKRMVLGKIKFRLRYHYHY